MHVGEENERTAAPVVGLHLKFRDDTHRVCLDRANSVRMDDVNAFLGYLNQEETEERIPLPDNYRTHPTQKKSPDDLACYTRTARYTSKMNALTKV